MGVLIDSSVLIHFERSGTDASAYVKGREEDEAFLSVISASELLHGVHRAANQKIKAKRLMEDLEIAENRRIRGLGDRQRAKLLDIFSR